MRPHKRRGGGFSLLELVATTAIMAVVTTASIELLRTSQSAWNRHQSDQLRRRTAAAALRHVVRAARQAAAVSAISAATDNSGALSLLRADGATLVWEHDGAADEIRYGEGAAAELLAENVTGMTLVGLKADGATPTVDPNLIHAIRCTVTYNVERPTGPIAEQVSTHAWLRSW